MDIKAGKISDRTIAKWKELSRLEWKRNQSGPQRILPFLVGATPLNLGRYTLFHSEINNPWC
jgi:ribosome biogenesis protein Tsr3